MNLLRLQHTFPLLKGVVLVTVSLIVAIIAFLAQTYNWICNPLTCFASTPNRWLGFIWLCRLASVGVASILDSYCLNLWLLTWVDGIILFFWSWYWTYSSICCGNWAMLNGVICFRAWHPPNLNLFEASKTWKFKKLEKHLVL